MKATDGDEREPGDVTKLLRDWSGGNRGALDALVPIVHRELEKLARSYLRRERDGHTLETKALINEAYLRLVDQDRMDFQNRAHFFGIAAQMMRRVLVDHARKRLSHKRGGGAAKVPYTDSIRVPGEDPADILSLHEALDRLEEVDPRQAKLIELKYFGELSLEETAEVLGVSLATVKREWATGKTWLKRQMTAG